MKDLLRTADLSRADVDLLLDTAADFAKNPLRSKDALAHKSVAIYMTKPSTRTRLSSETAVAHLGGTPIFLRGDELQLGRGETIADTARIMSGYCDAIIIRTFAQSDVDVIQNYPISVEKDLSESGFGMDAYPYYELSYYSNGKSRVIGLINKVRTNDRELLSKLRTL